MSVDYHSLTQQQRNKKRQRASPRQLEALLKAFCHNPRPDCCEREAIGSQIDMTPRSVQIWFQNMRAKQRLNGKLNSLGSHLEGHSKLRTMCNADQSRVWLEFSTPPTPLTPTTVHGPGFVADSNLRRWPTSYSGQRVGLAVSEGKVRIACDMLQIGNWVCLNSKSVNSDSHPSPELKSHDDLWAYLDSVRHVLSYVALENRALYAIDVPINAISLSTVSVGATRAVLTIHILKPELLAFRTKQIDDHFWNPCGDFTGQAIDSQNEHMLSGPVNLLLASHQVLQSAIAGVNPLHATHHNDTSTGDMSTQAPPQLSLQAPQPISLQGPLQAPLQIPSQVPSQVSSQVSPQVPSRVPSQVPSRVPSQVPSQVSLQVPSQVSLQASSQVPSQVSSQVPSQAPLQTGFGNNLAQSQPPEIDPNLDNWLTDLNKAIHQGFLKDYGGDMAPYDDDLDQNRQDRQNRQNGKNGPNGQQFELGASESLDRRGDANQYSRQLSQDLRSGLQTKDASLTHNNNAWQVFGDSKPLTTAVDGAAESIVSFDLDFDRESLASAPIGRHGSVFELETDYDDGGSSTYLNGTPPSEAAAAPRYANRSLSFTTAGSFSHHSASSPCLPRSKSQSNRQRAPAPASLFLRNLPLPNHLQTGITAPLGQHGLGSPYESISSLHQSHASSPIKSEADVVQTNDVAPDWWDMVVDYGSQGVKVNDSMELDFGDNSALAQIGTTCYSPPSAENDSLH